MNKLFSTTLTALLFAHGALAQDDADDNADAMFGGDRYIAGRDVSADQTTPGDLFMVGERVSLEAEAEGSVHAAGRRIMLDAPVGGSVYAFGYSVDIAAPIAGGASITGAELSIEGDIGGNLRAAGSEVDLLADVAGVALLAGGEVLVDGVVSGDLIVATDDLSFGDDAEVLGQLTVYAGEPDGITVPSRVASEDRVTVRDAREADEDRRHTDDGWGPGPGTAVLGFVTGVLTVAAITAMVVFIAPNHLAGARRYALEHPLRSLLFGFLGMSMLAGMGIVLVLTLIGLLLVPASILLAFLAGLVGYALGSYIFGVGLWMLLGNPEPETPMQKVMLAALGAFASGILVLIPLLGWFFLLALMFLGLGASLRLIVKGAVPS